MLADINFFPDGKEANVKHVAVIPPVDHLGSIKIRDIF